MGRVGVAVVTVRLVCACCDGLVTIDYLVRVTRTKDTHIQRRVAMQQ